MAKLQAKYRVDCDPPGMQIPGTGVYFKGASIVPPDTILDLPSSFEPHACMTPLNHAAKDAFDRKRKKVEKEWRESLAGGQTPDGTDLENPPKSKEELEKMLKNILAKVGPNGRKLQRAVTKAKKPKPPPMSVGAAETDGPDDGLLADADEDAGAVDDGQRASDTA